MARLQDYPSVTPTSSDKLLVVQSQGQGLVPYGSKLDSANPTGTGSLSLNRKSGTTVGSYSTAEGYNCEASGAFGTHAEGNATKSSGGYGSHSEGSETQATGAGSHAEGGNSVASGQVSHAEGQGTIANHRCQHVFGEYNTADPSTAAAYARGNYIEVVGKGSSDSARSNARTLDWSGNEVLAGGLKINGTTDVHGSTITLKTQEAFTSTTTLTYTGKSISCPTGHLYIVSASALYVNQRPLEFAVSGSQTAINEYSCYYRSTESMITTFILHPNDTAYFWAKYSGAGTNAIQTTVIDIKL